MKIMIRRTECLISLVLGLAGIVQAAVMIRFDGATADAASGSQNIVLSVGSIAAGSNKTATLDYSTSTALLSDNGSTYTGQSVYGGFSGSYTNTGGSAFDQYWTLLQYLNGASAEDLRVNDIFTSGTISRSAGWALMFGSQTSIPLNFDAGSRLTAKQYSTLCGTAEARWVVVADGTTYLSQSTIALASSSTINTLDNPDEINWAAWTPGADMTFGSLSYNTLGSSLNNITLAGVAVNYTAAASDGSGRYIFQGFTADVISGPVAKEDFESYTAGASPAGQNGWSTVNVQTSETTNQNALVVSTNGIGGGATQAVQIKDDWAAGGNFQLENSFTGLSSFQIQFDVKLNNLNQLPVLNLNGVSNATAVTSGLQLAIDGGGTNKFGYNDGSWKSIAITDDADDRLDVDAWYTIQLSAANLTGSGDTWSLVVKNASGTTVVNETGLAFKKGMTAVDTAIFQFNIDTSGGDMLIDNYSATSYGAVYHYGNHPVYAWPVLSSGCSDDSQPYFTGMNSFSRLVPHQNPYIYSNAPAAAEWSAAESLGRISNGSLELRFQDGKLTAGPPVLVGGYSSGTNSMIGPVYFSGTVESQSGKLSTADFSSVNGAADQVDGSPRLILKKTLTGAGAGVESTEQLTLHPYYPVVDYSITLSNQTSEAITIQQDNQSGSVTIPYCGDFDAGLKVLRIDRGVSSIEGVIGSEALATRASYFSPCAWATIEDDNGYVLGASTAKNYRSLFLDCTFWNFSDSRMVLDLPAEVEEGVGRPMVIPPYGSVTTGIRMDLLPPGPDRFEEIGDAFSDRLADEPVWFDSPFALYRSQVPFVYASVVSLEALHMHPEVWAVLAGRVSTNGQGMEIAVEDSGTARVAVAVKFKESMTTNQAEISFSTLSEGASARLILRTADGNETIAAQWNQAGSWQGFLAEAMEGREVELVLEVSGPVGASAVVSGFRAGLPPPAAPQLSFPRPDAIHFAAGVSFLWELVDDVFEYTLQLSSDAQFSTPTNISVLYTAQDSFRGMLIETGFFPEEKLASGLWYWRVKAHGLSDDSEWSEAQSFTVETFSEASAHRFDLSNENFLLISRLNLSTQTGQITALDQALQAVSDELSPHVVSYLDLDSIRLVRDEEWDDFFDAIAATPGKFMISPISRSGTDLSICETALRRCTNVIGICQGELFWGLWADSARNEAAKRLLEITAAYGASFVWGDGQHGDYNWLMLQEDSQWSTLLSQYGDHLIPAWKMNILKGQYTTQSAILGMQLQGKVEHTGVMPEDFYWVDAGFGPEIGDFLGIQQGYGMPTPFWVQNYLLGLAQGSSVFFCYRQDLFWDHQGETTLDWRYYFGPFFEFVQRHNAIPSAAETSAMSRRVKVSSTTNLADRTAWDDYGSFTALYRVLYGMPATNQWSELIPDTPEYRPVALVQSTNPPAPDILDLDTVSGVEVEFDYSVTNGVNQAFVYQDSRRLIVMNPSENMPATAEFGLSIDVDETSFLLLGDMAVHSYMMGVWTNDLLYLHINGRLDGDSSELQISRDSLPPVDLDLLPEQFPLELDINMVTLAVTERSYVDPSDRPVPAEYGTLSASCNEADSNGFGRVEYEYAIGKTEVTVEEWTPFYRVKERNGAVGSLNSLYTNWVASAGSLAPAVKISFHQAAQYCNWLTTGRATNGAYTISSSGTVVSVNRDFRNAAGLLYVLPTEDEWYKAAYFKPDRSGYSAYAFGMNTAPTAGVNSCYNNTPSASPWAVGSGTTEQNGILDLSGNVFEWVENLAGVRYGGAYNSPESGLSAAGCRVTNLVATTENEEIGFRVVMLSGVSEGFESFTVESSPAGQNGWSTVNVQTSETTNQNALVVSTNGIGGGPTQAVQIKDDWAAGGIFQLKNSFTGLSSFQIQFDVKLNNLNQLSVLNLNGVSNATAVTSGLQLAIDGGGTIKFGYNDGTWKTVAIPGDADGRLNTNSWYTIQLSAANLTGDKSVDTWSLTLKDASGIAVVRETGLGFKAGMTAVNTAIFQFNIDTSGGDMLIDNYSVRTAEPIGVADSFGRYPVETSPAGQNGWSTVNVQTSETTNQNTLVVSTNGIGGGPTQAVQIKDDWAAGGILQLKSSFSSQSSFQITYDVQLKSLLQAPTFRLNGVSNATAVTTGLQLAMDSGAAYKFAYNDGTWKTIVIPGDADGRLDVNAWYTFEISAEDLTGNPAIDTWSLTVMDASGTIVVHETGLAFKVGMTAVSSADFFFNSNTSGGDMLIDNYSVGEGASRWFP